MNAIKSIRVRLELTQAALAAELGCTQSNVGHYENKGQRVLPEVAMRLIDVAARRGLPLTMGMVYGVESLPAQPTRAAAAAAVADMGAA